MEKKEKRKKRRGGGIAGIGVLALAALLAMDPFGLGIGDGLGQLTGGGNITGIPNDDETPSETPQATQTPGPTEAPQATETPVPTEAVEVVLKEVSVVVNRRQILYDAKEVESAQRLTAQLVSDYAEDLENLIVKISLKDAVYDTVEELKLALENCGLKYEIVE